MSTYKVEITVDAPTTEAALTAIAETITEKKANPRIVKQYFNSFYMEEEYDPFEDQEIKFEKEYVAKFPDEDPNEGDRGSHQDQAPEDFIPEDEQSDNLRNQDADPYYSAFEGYEQEYE